MMAKGQIQVDTLHCFFHFPGDVLSCLFTFIKWKCLLR